MEFNGKNRPWIAAAAIAAVLLSMAAPALGSIGCGMVNSLVSSCSSFVISGTPEPDMTSPCCDGLTSLNSIVSGCVDKRRSACRCLVTLVAAFHSNVTTINRLPGLCRVSPLGFTLDPDTDCNNIP